MYNRLYKFLVENNILYQKQFRLQNAHSTEHAILQLVNQTTEAFIFLEKLKGYGIQSENLKLFRSYLSNRKQFILFEDFKTEIKIVKCGVHQTSMLGPLLFFVFVNNLNNSTKVLDPVLFTDDANLFCSDNNIRVLFQTANQGLSNTSL